MVPAMREAEATKEDPGLERIIKAGAPTESVWTPAWGSSPPEASEFLLQKCVVLGACLIAFQPLHVVLNPHVVAFRHKAREGVRCKSEVHQSALGTLLKHAPLPVLGLLMAMLTVCQVPKLLTS